MGVGSPPIRLGLLGGSFDPVHCAHLALARAALTHLGLNEIIWLPAGRPWQKEALGASASHRLAMLQLALANETGMQVDAQELQREGATYTIDTLAALGAGSRTEVNHFWLLGSDQLRNFTTWHRWRDIVSRVDLAVAQRPGHAPEAPAELSLEMARHGRALHTIPLAPCAVSATDIRQRAADGRSLAGLVSPAVQHYIQQHHLYQPR